MIFVSIRLIQMVIAGLLVSLFFLEKLCEAQTPIAHQIALPSDSSWCDDSMINGLFTQINNVRSQHGVPTVKIDTVGMKDAEIRATQFAAYMAQHAPGSVGFNPHEGYDTTAANLSYNIIGENLAYITTDPVRIVYEIWQDPLHLAALLAPDATVVGVSCIFANGTPFWTYEPGIGTTLNATSIATPDSEGWTFLTLINNFRAQNGAGPLQVSMALENSSQWMSNDMAAKNYVSHTDSLGRTAGVRLAAFGYPYSSWGENIAAGFSDAQSTFNQWATACDPDSSGNCTFAHRQNMLNPSFVVIGIGRAFNGNSTYGWYWTTDFGGVLDATILPPNPGQPPGIVSFTASPSTIVAGQSTTLTWSVSGAGTVTIDNGIGDVSSLTSRVVSPTQTTKYILTASNSAGSASASMTVTVGTAQDTQPPTPPTLVSVVTKNATEVDLTWTPSSDNVGVAGYQVSRSGAIIASLANTIVSYADTTAAPNTTYTYVVKGYDAAGNFSSPSNSVQVTTPPVTVSQSCPPPATGAFTGCYYGNTNLTGNPSFVRTDNQINYDWGSGTPDSSLAPDNFSVRWQGIFNFAGGDYTFAAITSDGMRIYIDGNNVLDRWRDQPPYMYFIRQTLSPGNHLVVVEYYERTNSAIASLTWQGNAAPQAPMIKAFSASPVAITAGQSSTLSWTVTGANSISIDNGIGDVSNLTSKPVFPSQTTTYRLTASSSGGTVTAVVTVSVGSAQDNQPPTTPTIVSAAAKAPTEVDLIWTTSTDNVGVAGYQVSRNGTPIASVAATTLSYADVSVVPNGSYTYSVKAYDAAGNFSAASNGVQVTTPSVPASSSCPGPASGVFSGCYYNNTDLSGNPVLVRTDNEINFDWRFSPPGNSLSTSNFSVRWQGIFRFVGGNYTFTATTSDGMRIYIDGINVLDRWRDQSPTMYFVRQTLSPGDHLIVVEYYDRTNSATANVSWQNN